MGRWMDDAGKVDGWIIDGRVVQCLGGWMDLWMMDIWMDGQIDG